MAIYHLEAKVISRGVGRSAVAASAYMSCSRIYNDYDGVQHDYTRKHGLVYEQVLLPPQAPPEWKDRSVLWNAVEEAEKSKDSRLAREFVVALPVELGKEQNISLISKYIKDNFVANGMCADFCIHDTDGHNPHAHIMLTVRPLDENGKWQNKTEKEYLCIKDNEERGFTSAEFKTAQLDGWEKQYQYIVSKKKVYMPLSQGEAQGYERASKYPKSTRYGRQNPIAERWNSEEQLQIWRKNWADINNLYLERKNIDERIDHRSHKERGIDEQPTIHEGITARIIEQKGGTSERCEINRQIKADNKLLRELKESIKNLAKTVMESIPKIAHALEKLRGIMIHCRYVISFTDKWKTAKKQEVNALEIGYSKYSDITDRLQDKITERKQLQAEKQRTPAIKVFRHKKLTQDITELSEQIEELRTDRELILSMYRADDVRELKTKISNIQKAMPVMERHAEESREKLNSAQNEFAELKLQSQDFDADELEDLCYAVRPQTEAETAYDLQKIYGNSFDRDLFSSARTETDNFNGETERRSIRKMLERNKAQQQPYRQPKQHTHDDWDMEL